MEKHQAFRFWVAPPRRFDTLSRSAFWPRFSASDECESSTRELQLVSISRVFIVGTGQRNNRPTVFPEVPDFNGQIRPTLCTSPPTQAHAEVPRPPTRSQASSPPETKSLRNATTSRNVVLPLPLALPVRETAPSAAERNVSNGN